MTAKHLRRMSKDELVRELHELETEARGSRANPDDAGREHLLQELRIHQVELEMRDRELREMEDRLERSTARYSGLYDSAPVGYCTLDPAGRIHEINQTACTLLAVPRARLIGKPFQTAAGLRDKAPFLLHLRRVNAGERATSEIVLSPRGRRGARVVQLISDPIRDADGAIQAYRSILVDITAQKAMEAQVRMLADAGAHLAASLDTEAVLDAADRAVVPGLADLCLIHLVSTSGTIDLVRVTFADPAKQSELGQRMREAKPQSGWRSPQAQVIASGEPMLLSEMPQPRDGASREESESGLLLRAGVQSFMVVPLTAHGRALGAITLGAAESGRRYAQTDLRLAMELAGRVAAALDNARLYDDAQRTNRLLLGGAKASGIVAISPDAIISIDEAHRITLWNDGAETIFGYSRAEAIGAPLDLLIPQRYRARVRRAVQTFANGPDVARRIGNGDPVVVGIRKDGSEFPADAAISKLEVGSEKVLTVAIRDVTEQKRLERERALETDVLGRMQRVGAMYLNDEPFTRVLEQILDTAIVITGADFGDVQVYEPRAGELKIVAHRGFPGWWLDFWNAVSRGKGVCGSALEAGQRVIVEDIERSPIFADPRTREVQLKAGVHAVQSTPLIGRGGVPLGMISTHFKTPGRPRERALQLLDLLARQATHIMERHHDDEALRVSEARFSGILSVSPDAIISVDDALRITLWNDAAEKIYGYSRAEALGAPITLVIPERLRSVYLTEIKAFAEGPEVARRFAETAASYVGLRKNGEEFPVDASISKLQVAGERILTISLRDITEQQRIEDQQRTLARMGELLASSLDYEETLSELVQLLALELADYVVLYLLDEDHGTYRVRAANRNPSTASYRQSLFPISAGATAENPASRVIETRRPLLLQVTPAVLMTLAHSEEHGRALTSLGLKSVMAVPLLAGENCLGALLFMSSTRPLGPADLALAEEIGRRTALLIENAGLHRTAQAAIHAREDVLGIVAHDLRNPLNTIMMEADILLMGEQGPERDVSESAAAIRRAGDRMTRLIRDLLDVTRIESGGLSIDRGLVPVAPTIAGFVKTQDAVASSAGLDLRADVAPDAGYVLADRDRFLQVMENLVGNAERFTPKGGQITIGATPRKQDVLFRVSDTGAGIEASALPHLFERFSPERVTDRKGTGLGLPIVKGIIEAHGGRVWVESTVGKGSTFFFTLPRAPAPSAKAGATAQTDLSDVARERSPATRE